MSIHQLVMFWRDAEARCFTAWHFQAAPGERATTRALAIWQAAQQLTRLQIYGAVCDTQPLRLATLAPAPPDGTATRLQISLVPANPKQVGGGQLRFGLPGPNPALARVVSAQDFAAPEWQLTERPHPAEAPFAAALSHTEEALRAAQQSYHQTPTEKVAARVAKYQTRLQLMQQWQEVEQHCFEQVIASPLVTIAAAASAVSLTALPQPTTATRMQEDAMTVSPQAQTIAQENLFVPMPTDDAALQDVPTAHFADPQMWLHRTSIREWLNLNERTYYRWVN